VLRLSQEFNSSINATIKRGKTTTTKTLEADTTNYVTIVNWNPAELIKIEIEKDSWIIGKDKRGFTL